MGKEYNVQIANDLVVLALASLMVKVTSLKSDIWSKSVVKVYKRNAGSSRFNRKEFTCLLVSALSSNAFK